MQIATIGLDIAKNVFQVHGIDAAENVVVRKQLRRSQVIGFFKALAPCLVGMEACATSHYWARELTKLGHQVRLMPAKHVKAYIKRNKNDAADAEAICEAVRRPTMRFVQVKSVDQQAQLMQHRARDLLMQQRTQLINAMRSHLAELGIIAPQGREGIKELLAIIANDDNRDLPNDARASLVVLAAQLQALKTTIGAIEKRIVVQHRANKESKRLQTVPGIGVIGASAIAATVTNPRVFRSGRDFAAWIGLVPRQMSTGGKPKLGPISKQGDRYLRRILVVGAVSILRRAKRAHKTLLNSKNLVQCDRKLLAKLRELNKPLLQQRLKPYINDMEIDGLLARRDKIVAFFDKEIAAKGEAAVLFELPRSGQPCGVGL